jgi:transcriptional regulator with XRE-family HTH domain
MPPARPADLARNTLSYQLRDVIDRRGLSAHAVGKAAGVDPAVVARFVSCERDVRLATADKIAAALGLRLVEQGKGRVKARRGPVA